MSLLGRVFVLGLFAVSCVGLVVAAAEILTEGWIGSRQSGESKSFRKIVKGAVAIVIGLSAIFLRSFIGWRRFLGLLAVLIVLLSLLMVGINRLSARLVKRMEELLDFSEVEDHAAEWIVNLLLLGIVVAWLCFLVFAPFGVLCALNVRDCGAR